MTADFTISDIELAEHVAGRESHEVKVGGIPGGHDNASVFGTVLDLVNAVCKLIDTLLGVVCVHVLVLRTEVSPLETVH